MTRIVDLIQNLRNDRFFTKIDLSMGYWQVPVPPGDIHKTAFPTPDGVCEFLRMPFGMVNSGATLTTAIRKLLRGIESVENYVNDNLVHTTTWDCHVATLRELWRRLAKAKFTVRPSKDCYWGRNNFCGSSSRLRNKCTT